MNYKKNLTKKEISLLCGLAKNSVYMCIHALKQCVPSTEKI